MTTFKPDWVEASEEKDKRERRKRPKEERKPASMSTWVGATTEPLIFYKLLNLNGHEILLNSPVFIIYYPGPISRKE